MIDLVVLPNEIRETARFTSGEVEWPKDSAAALWRLRTRAAQAHEEKGSDDPISEAEQAALTAISGALA